jgi:hypothetical protein
VDDTARIQLQLRLLLVMWRRELRRLDEGALSAEARAARRSEMQNRARSVLANTAELIAAAGSDPHEIAELDRARAEIDADGDGGGGRNDPS